MSWTWYEGSESELEREIVFETVGRIKLVTVGKFPRKYPEPPNINVIMKTGSVFIGYIPSNYIYIPIYD